MSEAQGSRANSGTSTVWQIVGRLVGAAVVLSSQIYGLTR